MKNTSLKVRLSVEERALVNRAAASMYANASAWARATLLSMAKHRLEQIKGKEVHNG